MGQTRPLFGLFLFFSQCKDKFCTNFTIKHRWSAWESNPGRHDRRRRRIHWAMATPPNNQFLICLSSSLNNVPLSASFVFKVIIFSTVNSKWIFCIKFYQWLNLNFGLLFFMFIIPNVKRRAEGDSRSKDMGSNPAPNPGWTFFTLICW